MNAEIADIINEYVARKQGGESVAPEKFAADHSKHRSELLRVLPTIEELEKAAPPNRIKPITLDELPEELVEEYQLKKLIGYGGMGTVYEAVDSLRSRVALKIIRTRGQGKSTKRFEREAKIVGNLHHPNIAPVFDFGRIENLAFMSMRFINGPNLSEILKAGRAGARVNDDALSMSQGLEQNWTKIARIGHQAANALDYAHRQGILHRDIKPANLIIDRDWNTWIVDFGLARFRDAESSLTRTGNTVGTIRYMAPEQLEYRADVRTDIYSLGLTLYELTRCTGRKVLSPYFRHPLKRPRDTQPTIPRALEKAILKACNPDPSKRFQTAAEFAEALNRCCQSGGRRQRNGGSTTQKILKYASILLLGVVGWFVAEQASSRIAETAGRASETPRAAGSERDGTSPQAVHGAANETKNTGQVSGSNTPSSISTPSLSTRSVFDLQIGDVIGFRGRNWKVEAQYFYDRDGFVWQSYLVEDGLDRAWVTVCEDDYLQISWMTTTGEVQLSGANPPVEIECDGICFRQIEAGPARMMRLNRDRVPVVEDFVYYDYIGTDHKLLTVEEWSSVYYVTVGEEILPEELSLITGDGSFSIGVGRPSPKTFP